MTYGIIMNSDSKIYVAGHNGLVGSAIIRKLKKNGYRNILTIDSSKLDLRIQHDVNIFFSIEKPEYVFLAAARVGGILYNSTSQADFIYDNTMIAFNVIKAAYEFRVKKLINLGSSCIYPKFSSQPIKEEYLLSNYLEPTNEGYAIAKIASIKLCEHFNTQYDTSYISVMPCNLYGINDNFDLETSHVLPALIHRIHNAKINNLSEIFIWGDGQARREFLYVDDLVDALFLLIENYLENKIINIGSGIDISIKKLAGIIMKIIDYNGSIVWDITKPKGTPRKLLDVSRMKKIGWTPEIALYDGIEKVYKWFKQSWIK